MTTKTRVPAIAGWFTMPEADSGEQPTLIGSRCTTCGSFFFPKTSFFCRNPECQGTEFDDAPLSRQGRVWSYTDAQYQPPPPFIVPGEAFEPFALAAVELSAEGLVVMGQMVPGVGVDDIKVGTEVELVLGTLYEDDDHTYVMWQWQPVAAGTGTGSPA